MHRWLPFINGSGSILFREKCLSESSGSDCHMLVAAACSASHLLLPVFDDSWVLPLKFDFREISARENALRI